MRNERNEPECWNVPEPSKQPSQPSAAAQTWRAPRRLSACGFSGKTRKTYSGIPFFELVQVDGKAVHVESESELTMHGMQGKCVSHLRFAREKASTCRLCTVGIPTWCCACATGTALPVELGRLPVRAQTGYDTLPAPCRAHNSQDTCSFIILVAGSMSTCHRLLGLTKAARCV